MNMSLFRMAFIYEREIMSITLLTTSQQYHHTLADSGDTMSYYPMGATTYNNYYNHLKNNSTYAALMLGKLTTDSLKINVLLVAGGFNKFYTPYEVQNIWRFNSIPNGEALITFDPTQQPKKVFRFPTGATIPTITSNPISAPSGSITGTQSPKIALIHEFGHAYDYINDKTWYNAKVNLALGGDGVALLAIEDHNVMHNESKVAKDLVGEGVRYFYKHRLI